jgi:hypothetical protein
LEDTGTTKVQVFRLASAQRQGVDGGKALDQTMAE